MKLIKTFSKKMADFQATFFLSLCFFLFVPLFALIIKSTRKIYKDTWIPWNISSETLDDIRKQY